MYNVCCPPNKQYIIPLHMAGLHGHAERLCLSYFKQAVKSHCNRKENSYIIHIYSLKRKQNYTVDKPKKVETLSPQLANSHILKLSK